MVNKTTITYKPRVARTRHNRATLGDQAQAWQLTTPSAHSLPWRRRTKHSLLDRWRRGSNGSNVSELPIGPVSPQTSTVTALVMHAEQRRTVSMAVFRSTARLESILNSQLKCCGGVTPRWASG